MRAGVRTLLDAKAQRLWQHPDKYDWLTGYLQSRHVINRARAAMVVVVGGPLLALTFLLHSVDGPTSGAGRTLAWLPTIVGALALLLWIWRWPSRTQFAIFAVSCSTALALVCLLIPDPRSSLTCTYALMIAGTLLALFQSAKLMAYNFVLVAAVVATAAIRLAGSGHLSLVAVALVQVLLANVAIPIAAYRIVGSLGNDLAHADRDPLTGLYNRRAFRTETLGWMLTGERGTGACLTIVLLDLDAFKAVNDTYGHDAGDRVLVQVAQTLLATVGDSGIVSRSGGEEFLVATTDHPESAQLVAQRMCDAIAASPVPVTASVGSATARLDDNADRDHRGLLEQLIIAADTAMYRAKRNGGNQTYHFTGHSERRAVPGQPENHTR